MKSRCISLKDVSLAILTSLPHSRLQSILRGRLSESLHRMVVQNRASLVLIVPPKSRCDSDQMHNRRQSNQDVEELVRCSPNVKSSRPPALRKACLDQKRGQQVRNYLSAVDSLPKRGMCQGVSNLPQCSSIEAQLVYLAERMGKWRRHE